MAILRLIDKQDIQFLDVSEQSKIQYQGDAYAVECSKAEEIRMGYYIRTIKIFKDQRLLQSGEIPDPEYLNLTSPDNRFMFIPFRNNFEIMDLQTGNSLSLDAGWLVGNHFDQTSRYFLIVNFDEIRLMDLWENKVLWNRCNRHSFIGQAQFGSDNYVWMIKKDKQRCLLQKLDPVMLTETIEDISSPFEFFNIDPAPYSKLLALDKHCLWNKKGGGMAHSSLLNSWQFVNTSLGSVYKSPIPVSDIRYSDNFRTETCDVEFCYVRIN